MDKYFSNEVRFNLYPKGISLKKYSLKKWIYANGFTQPYVARRMGIAPYKFKLKLKKRRKFSRRQIERLVYFMGAMEAFNVLYFPIKSQRSVVYKCVFKNEQGDGMV